jgi:hypothetical protein
VSSLPVVLASLLVLVLAAALGIKEVTN